MNGIFSNAPSPGVIRLVVSGLLFGVVQAAILLAAPTDIPSPRSLIILLGLLTLGCFIGAVIGESAVDPKDRWRNRGGP
ncbi:MAG: hypothetical protein LCH74_17960 [Proteobacteria bacterium]|nr:hypothetical protein [Pseudomonadota bacterium]